MKVGKETSSGVGRPRVFCASPRGVTGQRNKDVSDNHIVDFFFNDKRLRTVVLKEPASLSAGAGTAETVAAADMRYDSIMKLYLQEV